MNKNASTIVLVIIVAIGLFFFQIYQSKKNPSVNQETSGGSAQIPMQLTSSAFEHNGTIPLLYTCDGNDVNPPLAWSDVPAVTKSLALIVDDPDAPPRKAAPRGTRGDWVHWLVWNIDPTTQSVAKNSVPPHATQGTTDFGHPGYGGPCPPSGTHHYQFKLFALDTALDLPASTKKSQLEAAMAGHIVDQTLLIGLYQR